MSRIPSGPQPVPAHYGQQLPPPQGYYPIAVPPNFSQPLPPMSAAYAANIPATLYPVERGTVPPVNGGWMGPDGFNGPPAAGPSRPTGTYPPYHQPPRSSPTQVMQPRNAGPPNGWQPVAPTARGVVKLEDLVSAERPGSAPAPPPAKAVPSAPLSSVPLSVSGSFDTKRPTSAGDGGAAAPAGGGGGGGGNAPAGPSEFIKKLYKMLEEESQTFGKGRAGKAKGEGAKRGSVGWGKGGTTFVVWDMNDFTTKVLPQTFRHSNFSSFVRQLNKYGFSKIKHVDEESGTIKENIWEFQHPSFQAGGKSDLENIKRKTVATKKGPAGDFEDASPRGAGMTAEESSRLNLMENRIVGLEDKLSQALDELRDVKSRENGMMGLMRDVIGHLAASEKEVGSPSDANSPRVFHLLRSFETLAQSATASSFSTPLPSMSHRGSVQFQPLASFAPGVSIPSPRVDAAQRESVSGPSTRPPTAPGTMPTSAMPTAVMPTENSQMQTLFNGEPLGLTPMFDTPVWNGDAYGRKSSDGTTLRFVADTLGGASGIPAPAPSVRFDDSRDPLDTSSRRGSTVMPPPVAATNESPFGTLVPSADIERTIPVIDEPKATAPTSSLRTRRSTTIKPNWTQTPRILVVEDDVVYRQLSSKFLEKFGCITETVENAQGAVDKMNSTKYDLVLMDIFFGPNMDGRKATSLIRQFDNYTPIISMTSNARPQDVDSYFQSGMNDILAKPFTKHNLYLILDKHLVHLRHIQIYERLIPMSVGVPPLSDQHVVEALTVSAQNVQQQQQTLGNGVAGGALQLGDGIRNPLAGTGWSDDQYSLVLSQFLATGSMPDVGAISNGTIGTNLVFSDATTFNDRKRSMEAINEDDWVAQNSVPVAMPVQMPMNMGASIQEIPLMSSVPGAIPLGVVGANGQMADGRETKRQRGMMGA